MKESTKKVIFITLLSSALLFTLGFSFYVEHKTRSVDQKMKNFNAKMYGELSSAEGYKYGVKYLYDRNLVRRDTTVTFTMEGMTLPVNKTFDSCTFEDYFFKGFKHCLTDAYVKGYLIKKDSIVEKMMFDFDSIETDYFNTFKK